MKWKKKNGNDNYRIFIYVWMCTGTTQCNLSIYLLYLSYLLTDDDNDEDYPLAI